MLKFCAGILFFICSILTVKGQNIDSSLFKYATQFAQEKAYIHFDKSSYLPGETIWFKAYLLEGVSPAFHSKTFYIDWTDENGNLVSQTVSPLEGAVTNGQFDIPVDYTGDFLHVRAYTKWMLNFDSSFLYQKDIRVVQEKKKEIFKENKIIPELVFFPEGGDAVEGVSNKIAFKANDQWGRPVKVTGKIVDQNQHYVDSLHVSHDGMGFFYLFPRHGESYTAKWEDESGKEYTTSLPRVKEEGVALKVEQIATRRIFYVTANNKTTASLKLIHVIGTMNQFQAFKVTKDISGGTVRGVIPIENLPSGVLTITVFDSLWNPLAERITFINNEEYRFTAEMNVLHWGLNKRARNEIEISVPDSLTASFSVAVTDAGIDSDSSENIISHLLLSSEIKGKIHNPAYYFSSTEVTVSQNLDLVMLTHGWRRFDWSKLIAGKYPVINYPKDTAYLSLSGKVYGVSPAQLRATPTIILVVSNKNNNSLNKMFFLPVDAKGKFEDPSFILFDTVNVYHQLSKSIRDASVAYMEDKLAAYRFRLPATGFFYNGIGDTTGFSRHFRLTEELRKALEQYKGKMLENVTIKSRTKSPLQLMDEKYTSGFFTGGDNYSFDFINDKSANTAVNVFTFLQGRVAGLTVSGNMQSPTLQWRGSPVSLFIDEVPIDVEFVSSINVSDIAFVKVFRPPFFGAPGGGSGGAISIYTRKGDDVQNTAGTGLSKASVTGYSPIKQFYSPNYSSFTKTNEQKDFRTTLYWNPQVFTTAGNNKAVLTFYNNDVSDAFRVIIEGMTMDGQLIHLEQIIE